MLKSIFIVFHIVVVTIWVGEKITTSCEHISGRKYVWYNQVCIGFVDTKIQVRDDIEQQRQELKTDKTKKLHIIIICSTCRTEMWNIIFVTNILLDNMEQMIQSVNKTMIMLGKL